MKLLGYSIYPHMTQLSNTESASKELPADLHLSPPESNKKYTMNLGIMFGDGLFFWTWLEFSKYVRNPLPSPTVSGVCFVFEGITQITHPKNKFSPSRCSPMADPRHLCFEHSSLGTGPHHLQHSDLASMAVGDLKLRFSTAPTSPMSPSNRNPRIWMSFCLMHQQQFAWRLMEISLNMWLSGTLSSINTLHFTSTLMASGRGGKSRACGKFESFDMVTVNGYGPYGGTIGRSLSAIQQFNSHYLMNHIIWNHMISDMDALWYSHSAGWSPNC